MRDFSGQVFVRGADHAHIHAHGLRTAQAFKALLLQHAQQLGLRFEVHIADLVQKQRAPVREFKLALTPCGGTGERASFVTEHFALDQLGRQCGGIDRDKGPRGSPALFVDGPRDEFLARAALAGDEHSCIGAGHLVDQIADFLHGPTAANQQAESGSLPNLVAEGTVFPAQAHGLEDVFHRVAQFIYVVGLAQIIVRAGLHRLYGDPLGPVRGDHDHGPPVSLFG